MCGPAALCGLNGRDPLQCSGARGEYRTATASFHLNGVSPSAVLFKSKEAFKLCHFAPTPTLEQGGAKGKAEMAAKKWEPKDDFVEFQWLAA